MSFRRWAPLALILTSFVITSCAKENEDPGDGDFDGGKAQCLSQATHQIESFVVGKASEADVHQFWNCASFAVDAFRIHVRGKKVQVYSKKEILRFLEKFFLGDIKISDRLMDEFMKLKRLAIRGEATNLTHKELAQVQVLIEDLRMISLEILPHMAVLTKAGPQPGESSSLRPEQIDAAGKALKKTGRRIGKLIRNNQVDYSFESLESLFVELALLFKANNPETRLSHLYKAVPLIARVKSLLVTPGEKKVSYSDWPLFFQKSAEAYHLYQRIDHFVVHGQWRQGLGLEQLGRVARQTFQILSEGLSQRSNKRFYLFEAVELFRNMEDLFDLKDGTFAAKNLREVWRILMHRILPGLKEPGAKDTSAFNHAKLQILRQEYLSWEKAQAHIAKQQNSFEARYWGASVIDEGVAEMNRIITSSPWPLMNDSEGRLLLTRSPEAQHSIRSLSDLNLERILIRWLFKVYADQGLQGSMDLASLGKTYQHLKPLAVAFGIVDEDNDNLHSRILREGNVFLPRGDGDGRLSYVEGLEYFHYVLTGLGNSSLIAEDLERICPKGEASGYDSSCYRDQFLKDYSHYLAGMPGMVSFLNESSQASRQDFLSATEETLRSGQSTDEPFVRGDFVETIVLLQYIETVMLRFDQDGDDKIDVGEAVELAFPVFDNVLEDLVGGLYKTREERLAFFTYLLSFGEPPFGGDRFHRLRFLHWQRFPEKWEFFADRKKILLILAALAKVG